MRRTFALLVGFAFLLAMSTLLLAQGTKKEEPVKPVEPKPIHKTVMGKVAEITDTALKLTRTVKGTEETMEFILEKPHKHLTAGEEVKVVYHEKDGKNIVMAVHKVEKHTQPTTEKKTEPVAK